MKANLSLILGVLIVFLIFSCGNKLKISSMLVEREDTPVVAISTPTFGWQIESSENGVVQHSYNIVVAENEKDIKSGNNLIWNSGVIASPQSQYVVYEGEPFKSNRDYYWQLTVVTNKGEVKSPISKFSTAFMSKSDWSAKWIGIDSLTNPNDSIINYTRLSARYLRKEFNLKSKVKRAKLYICGLGMYECFINGEKVGDDLLSPAYCEYDKRVFYNVHDVTSVLSSSNSIGVVLGNGRFFPCRVPVDPDLERRIGRFRNFGFPKLILQLEIEYNDGSKERIQSDESWKLTTKGPIIANNEYDGEEYDANLEVNGWDKVGFDDTDWQKAREVNSPKGELVLQPMPNHAAQDIVKPIAINKIGNDTYILNMGQNMCGVLKMKLKGKKNKPITMHYTEDINSDGSINYNNLRTARCKTVYIPSNDDEFTWKPKFTYYGFQYVEIKGLDYQPALEDFEGIVMYDKMETIGTFNSSNDILNKIFKNAFWGIRGNYHNGPTDCPQRDERHFWLGDRSTNCFGESFIFNNHKLYSKWTQDMEDSQLKSGSLPDMAPFPGEWDFENAVKFGDNITWPGTYFFVTQMVYERFGDTRPIFKHYKSMVKWIDYIFENYLTDGILYIDNYSDWCVPPVKDGPANYRHTDGAVLATTTMYNILNMMSNFAKITGNNGDSERFLVRAGLLKNAYNDKYLNKEHGYYNNNSVTANVMSLVQGLTPKEYEQKVIDNVANNINNDSKGHVNVGVLGIQFLMRALTNFGQPELAYKLATNKTYPSWGYMIESGATTIWELWDANTSGSQMNSKNHVMQLGDLIIWYYEKLAGIKSDPNNVGFSRIIMNPIFPKELDFVDASYNSIYGVIKSNWVKSDNNITWDIVIPANTSALVTLPVQDMETIVINGVKMSENKDVKRFNANGAISLEVGSGNYKISFNI